MISEKVSFAFFFFFFCLKYQLKLYTNFIGKNIQKYSSYKEKLDPVFFSINSTYFCISIRYY